MTEEKIWERASEVAFEENSQMHGSLGCLAQGCDFELIRDSYYNGVKWALENQWHDAHKELPERNTIVLVILENGDYDLCLFNDYDRFCPHINPYISVKYWLSIPKIVPE